MTGFPEVVQVIPTIEHTVYLYFDDGNIKLYDAKDLITKGIFKPLGDINLFIETCTVLNRTLAWTLDKSYDRTTCLDLDATVLYETCPNVEEPTELFLQSS